jgi:aminoglycoside phosphotransferase (APT) family kinase protein
MPAAEVEVTEELVRRLLADQHHDLSHLPVVVMANGWDNVLLRIGDDLVARLPRRALGAELVAHEQRWLPMLQPRLPLPVPAPVRVGRPGFGYPWSWSIVAFMPGQVAAVTPPADPREAAISLGGFLGALHSPADPDAPANPFRGIPLAGRTVNHEANLAAVADLVDSRAVQRVWDAALAAPAWSGPAVWLHGDLHPANIVVHEGRISGVIDFGDITSGDPATDLSVAWMLLPADHHEAFRTAYAAAGQHRADDTTWARAKGWALAFGLVFLAHSADNPVLAEVGRHTMDAVLAS